MKTVIKIVIALALANAVVRTGLVALDYYQLKDAAQQELTFGERVPQADIVNRVYAKAEELEIPLGPESVEFDRDQDRTIMSVSYTQPIELFPSYIYPAELSFRVEARTLRGL